MIALLLALTVILQPIKDGPPTMVEQFGNYKLGFETYVVTNPKPFPIEVVFECGEGWKHTRVRVEADGVLELKVILPKSNEVFFCSIFDWRRVQ